MSEPVLVVHGVSNRDASAFESTVGALNAAVGKEWLFVPVFWGDLGAIDNGVEDTLPQMKGMLTRASGLDAAYVTETVLDVAGTVRVRAAEIRRDIVAEAAEAAFQGADGGFVRSDQGALVRTAVEEEWPQTKWLRHIEHEEVLRTIGQAVGEIVRQHGGATEGFATRGIVSDLKQFTKAVLAQIDETVGAVLGEVLGSLQQHLRREIAPGVTRFLGDVFVYQRHREEIQARLWATVDASCPDYGTAAKPLSVIAHSLGGTISLDAALNATRRLWIRRFVTFGSQPAFFHVLDPRSGIAPYSPGPPPLPVTLPAAIGKWTNLWEPLDPLAFVVSRVFRLNSGSPPEDLELEHLASSGLWTHSAYWNHPEAARRIREALS